MYIKFRNKRTYQWIVQTNTTHDLIVDKLRIKNKVQVLPFFQETKFQNVNKQLNENNTKFLYVANEVKQKNHLNLFKAWEILREEKKLLPELHLTIPISAQKLGEKITSLQKKGCKIFNHGHCDRDALENLYKNCNYLIFPSFAESFGLPLIEAAIAGCEIVAADMPYVYDVVKPLFSFDPYSPSDIARRVEDVLSNTSYKDTEVVAKNKILDLVNLLSI